MNKYEMQYILQTEGINGLTLKSRPIKNTVVIDSQTGKKIPVLLDIGADKETRTNDLRTYTSMGVIKPSEDYWIEGEGRTPLGIREVQTPIPGMKKYALLEEVRPQEDDSKKTKKRCNDKKKRISGVEDIVQYNARFVYSEGIDFKLMAEDEEYANQVIKIFQEKRLQEKQAKTEQLGLDVVYLGTIVKTENGYTIAGIKDYVSAVVKIASEIKMQEQDAVAKIEAKRKEERIQEENVQIQKLIQNLNPNQCKELLRQLFENFGDKGMYNMLKDVVAGIKENGGQPSENDVGGKQPDTEDNQWEL